MSEWTKLILVSPEWRLVTALAIGLLIGMERERKKGLDRARAAAGLRTFTLIALLGGAVTQTGYLALTVLAGTFVAAAALLGYALGDREDPGLTTEVAMVGTYMLGVLAQSQPVLAFATGVVTTVLLAARTPLHHFVRDLITERELHDGLAFFIAAAIVLPMVPNRTVDPFGLFNPFAYWRLAVVLMALSAAGHAGLRIFGARYGLSIAGLASGFVSSTVGIAAMGSRARADPKLSAASAAGASASVLGSFVFLAILLLTADPALVLRLTIPLTSAIVSMLFYSALLTRRGSVSDGASVEAGRAFDFRTVVTFTFVVGGFALLSSGLIARFGEAGVLAGAVATGLVDAHAASVSIATLVASQKMDSLSGALAIVLAISANMAIKVPAAFALGPRPFAVRVSLGLLILQLALWGGFLLGVQLWNTPN
jgi:uncharacterized membrane protein (DUF4010 family)